MAQAQRIQEKGDFEMRPEDLKKIKQIFAAYYEIAEFSIPSLEQREFGVGNVKKIDARHLDFANLSAFRTYLCNNTPLFVSHSAAYYGFPGATPMQKKQWKGADLIFDLDIHAEGRYGAYPKLDEIKEDLQRLVNDFLLNDFGIKREHITTVFSGNRGYHVHVRDPAYIALGGDERRELVDYIMGQGLNYGDFFRFTDTSPKKLMGPVPEEGGYRGRLARKTIQVLENKPTRLSRLFSKKEKRDFFVGGIREGNWSKTSLKLNDLLSRLQAVAESLPVSSVNTDAGVTQDLSKLIRVPNSIHGETGLVAKIVKDVDSFQPLRDALLESPTEIKIKFLEDVPELAIKDETTGFRKGDVRELSQPVALFYILKGSAELYKN
ncbi:DNA primase catalytic subunit PriS [Candidatus Micrarchaeota archaeon]|nr:DNA primase catalytic subunit PriS [Candidatus Micrarchaeota archaeon]